jgi:hypothetical protein
MGRSDSGDAASLCAQAARSLQGSLESDPATSRVRTKKLSDGGWEFSSSGTTDRACDRPVCLRCR